MKRVLAPVFWGGWMLVLILDSRTALAGAAEGVALCLRTLVPGLFPFFVLSTMLTASLPRGGLLAAGILGGYPVGARNVALAWRDGRLTQEEAERMAVLCNCAGPSFIFGAAGNLHPFRLWAVYLFSVAALWLAMPKCTPAPIMMKPQSLPDAVFSAVKALAGVCGWVILARTLLAVLDRWVLWMLPDWGQALAGGILELTNGILSLDNQEYAFVLAAGMLGFGGLCVMMQTASVTRGLSLRYYFPGKLFQSCVCMTAAALVQRTTLPLWFWGSLLMTGSICAVILRKSEIRYGNPVAVGV